MLLLKSPSPDFLIKWLICWCSKFKNLPVCWLDMHSWTCNNSQFLSLVSNQKGKMQLRFQIRRSWSCVGDVEGADLQMQQGLREGSIVWYDVSSEAWVNIASNKCSTLCSVLKGHSAYSGGCGWTVHPFLASSSVLKSYTPRLENWTFKKWGIWELKPELHYAAYKYDYNQSWVK